MTDAQDKATPRFSLKHFTVVYTVRDEAAFRASDDWRRIHDSMGAMHQDAPFAVTAMAMDHEMRRIALMEEAIDRYSDRYDAVEAVAAISACPDLSAWSWEQFENE